jgi:hypothetical protein
MGTRQYVQNLLTASTGAVDTAAIVARTAVAVEEGGILRDDALDQMKELGIALGYVNAAAATTGNWRVGSRRWTR